MAAGCRLQAAHTDALTHCRAAGCALLVPTAVAAGAPKLPTLNTRSVTGESQQHPTQTITQTNAWVAAGGCGVLPGGKKAAGWGPPAAAAGGGRSRPGRAACSEPCSARWVHTLLTNRLATATVCGAWVWGCLWAPGSAVPCLGCWRGSSLALPPARRALLPNHQLPPATRLGPCSRSNCVCASIGMPRARLEGGSAEAAPGRGTRRQSG